MRILAIDTSCDDTCIAIVEADYNPPTALLKGTSRKYQRGLTQREFKVRSNIVSSQVKIHQRYGGVYPTLAKREHQKNLVPVLERAIKGAKLREKIDAIAVTVGPGLEPCLWVGINFTKALAQWWKLPIIPVNHIEAHIFANFLPKVSSNFQFSLIAKQLQGVKRLVPIFNFQKIFPAVCLIVSGGHTQLILMKKIGDYKIIGETRDDAAGECFDKTARVLGLPYPGGPAIAAEAAKFSAFSVQRSAFRIKLPRPMINSKNYDFSFSGLKTAVLYNFKKRPASVKTMVKTQGTSPKASAPSAGKPKKEYVREMAKEIQQAIIDVLIKKTIKAAKNYKVKTIILGGGVTANHELRKQFKLEIKNLKLKINFLVPPKNLCTDNAAMVAIAGYFNKNKATKNLKTIRAEANLRL